MDSIEQKFNDSGVDAVTGTELMELLGISRFDFADNKRFLQFRDVIDYFKKFPIDTQRYMIRRVTNAKNVDKLQFVWEYAELLQRREAQQLELEKVRSIESGLGPDADPTIRIAHAQEELQVKGRLDDVNKEIALYE